MTDRQIGDAVEHVAMALNQVKNNEIKVVRGLYGAGVEEGNLIAASATTCVLLGHCLAMHLLSGAHFSETDRNRFITEAKKKIAAAVELPEWVPMLHNMQ